MFYFLFLALVVCPIDIYMVDTEKGDFYAQLLRASYSLLNIWEAFDDCFCFERGRKWLEVFSRKYNHLMELLSRTDFVGKIKIIKLVTPKTKTDTKHDKPFLEYYSLTEDYLEGTFMSDIVDMRQKMTGIKDDKPVIESYDSFTDDLEGMKMMLHRDDMRQKMIDISYERHSFTKDDLERMKMISHRMTDAKNDNFDKDTTEPPLTAGAAVCLDDATSKVKPKTGQKFILSPDKLKDNFKDLQNDVEQFVKEICFKSHHRFYIFPHRFYIRHPLKGIIQYLEMDHSFKLLK